MNVPFPALRILSPNALSVLPSSAARFMPFLFSPILIITCVFFIYVINESKFII